MDRGRVRNISAWVLSVLLTLAFTAAGLPKVLGVQAWTMKFAHWGYPDWLVTATGVAELIGGLLLLFPGLAKIGAGILASVMAGALYTHIANQEGLQILRPILFLAVLGAVVWLRRPPAKAERKIG